MSENPRTLTNQLANRVKTFAITLGLSQRQIAKLLKLDEGHLSRFLNGEAGLSAEMTLKVVRLTSLSKRELDLKFGRPEKTTSKIMHLQEVGQPMRLDGSGWVAKEGCEDDPNDSTSIVDTPTFRDSNPDDYQVTWDFLTGQQEILRNADQAIEDYKTGMQKARVNKGPTTEDARHVTDNADSSKPGPRNPKFSK